MSHISENLLELIACPACEDRPRLIETAEGLYCNRCKRIYPVIDGVPVLLVEEAILQEVAPEPTKE